MAAVFFDEEDDPKRRENPEGERVVGAHSGTGKKKNLDLKNKNKNIQRERARERVVGAHSGTNKKIKITEGTFLKRNRKKVSRGTGQNSQKSVPTTCTI